MFSGIVEELGAVARNAIESEGRLAVTADTVLRDVAIGDSIAVNGCCLTVVEAGEGQFVADVMPETARRTNLGALQPGDVVNLEAALRVGDRIGGDTMSGAGHTGRGGGSPSPPGHHGGVRGRRPP